MYHHHPPPPPSSIAGWLLLIIVLKEITALFKIPPIHQPGRAGKMGGKPRILMNLRDLSAL
jgi:hypothetical protein